MIRLFFVALFSFLLTFGFLAGYFVIMQSEAKTPLAEEEYIVDGATERLLEISSGGVFLDIERDLRVTDFRDIEQELDDIGSYIQGTHVDFNSN